MAMKNTKMTIKKGKFTTSLVSTIREIKRLIKNHFDKSYKEDSYNNEIFFSFIVEQTVLVLIDNDLIRIKINQENQNKIKDFILKKYPVLLYKNGELIQLKITENKINKVKLTY